MLEAENNIIKCLAEKFKTCDAETAAVSHHRVFLTIGTEEFLLALTTLKTEQGFEHLCAITGLDTGEGYEFIYHIANGDGILFNLKIKTPGGDGISIPSVLPIYNGATFYELELQGLLGVTVIGLPKDRQYPLPDNWPQGQYPGRKSWTSLTNKEQEA